MDKNYRKGKQGKKGEPMLYNEIKQQRKIMTTDTAWDEIGKAATKLGISRSELIERHGRNYHLIEAVLDAVEEVLHDGVSTEECLPPHPSYEVSGDVFRKLGSAFAALTEAENRMGDTVEEQIEKNKPAMEWAQTRIKEIEEKRNKRTTEGGRSLQELRKMLGTDAPAQTKKK